MAEKHKRKPRTGPPPDPDANWNEDPADTKDVLEQCTRIKTKIEEAPEHVWRRAASFFEDVDRKVTEVAETIARTRRVTDGQKNALGNWEQAVDRWTGSKE